MTDVQFSRQMRGSHAPVASQKGATVPLGSSTGWLLMAKSVAEVPRDITSCPSLSIWGGARRMSIR